MVDKDPSVAVAEAAATQVVKSLYPDLFQPAAREVGAELHEFVRAVMVAGRGFGYLIRETYEPFVLRALDGIPVGRRVPPPPPLLGQILEGISYEAEGSELYEMFEGLLRTSMDAERARSVHPTFPRLIKGLGPDEARILKSLINDPISGLAFSVDSGKYRMHRIDMPESVVNWGEADLYIENLTSLSLITSVVDMNIDNWKNHPDGELIPVKFEITFLARRLMAACQRPA